MKRFEEIPHTADWSFRAFGRDLRDVFANAAHALFSLQGASPRDAPRATMVKRNVRVEGIDYESLLVNWLNELLFLQEQHREVYERFNISRLTSTALAAQIVGKPRGKMDKIIKAVTYHNLKIEQTQEGWQSTLVVDV
jgi:SHS2 domain-containing protein